MKEVVPVRVDANACQLFIHEVLSHYAKEGRHALPWRTTKNPYRILVSEVMLQQTQVDRVIPKYQAFLKEFPTVQRLAEAPFKDVARMWQGLGYNRRALYLHKGAQFVVREHNNRIPQTRSELELVPGIGPYTAGAVRAFAFDAPEVFTETNIRSAFIHFFFPNDEGIKDKDVFPYIAYCVTEVTSPREWYWALMDYGSYIKKTFGNTSRKSAHHTVQSKFKGSNRELRGLLLRTLLQSEKPITDDELFTRAQCTDMRRDVVLSKLIEEGLMKRIRGKLTFA